MVQNGDGKAETNRWAYRENEMYRKIDTDSQTYTQTDRKKSPQAPQPPTKLHQKSLKPNSWHYRLGSNIRQINQSKTD